MFGHKVCKVGFCKLLAIGKQRLAKHMKRIDEGCEAPPMDHRSMSQRDDGLSDVASALDKFFLHIYTDVAEPLADVADDGEGENDESNDLEEDLIWMDDGHLGLGLGWMELDSMDLDPSIVTLAQTDDRKKLPVKWISNTSLTALFEEYTFYHSVHFKDAPASVASFGRVWRKMWKGVIKIRAVRQHARCAVCARLSQQRLKAQTQEEKLDLSSALAAHRQTIQADRAADGRLDDLAVRSNDPRNGYVNIEQDRIVKFDIDGMDQAKFKCPRNTPSTKAHEHLWRPELHITGVIVPGICEVYFSSDTDVQKGSNTQITVLSRALDIVKDKLYEKGLTMPEHIVFHAPLS